MLNPIRQAASNFLATLLSNKAWGTSVNMKILERANLLKLALRDSTISFKKFVKFNYVQSLIFFKHRLFLPVRLHQGDGSIANIFTFHLSHGFDVVVDICQWHESEPLGFERLFVTDDSGLEKRGILFEWVGKHLVIDFITHVATKNSEIVVGPVFKGLVNPGLITCLSCSLLFPFLKELFWKVFYLFSGLRHRHRHKSLWNRLRSNNFNFFLCHFGFGQDIVNQVEVWVHFTNYKNFQR